MYFAVDAKCNFDQVRTEPVFCYSCRKEPSAAVTDSADVNSAQMKQLKNT